MFVDAAELPGPHDIVEELAVVVSIVVRAVRLGVVARGDGRHLVSVDRVVPEKELHLFANLGRKNNVGLL